MFVTCAILEKQTVGMRLTTVIELSIDVVSAHTHPQELPVPQTTHVGPNAGPIDATVVWVICKFLFLRFLSSKTN